MLKWLIRIFIALAALALVAFLFRAQIGRFAFAQKIKPVGSFAEHIPPAAPDYASNTSWAALPETEDGADFLGPGLSDGQAEADMAVFFVYPTTFISKTGWNAPLDDAAAKARVDDLVLRAQASVYSKCCAIYAPYYRQATFWSFIDQTGSGQQALDLAYGDVSAAFDAFLARIGDKPFILAGHSQGARHTARLMAERVSGTPLIERFVVAYPIGTALQEETYETLAPDIPICQSAADTGCYVTWNSLGAKAKAFDPLHGAVCVNPLTWRQDDMAIIAASNPGSLSLSHADPLLDAGITGAQCLEDRLLVGPFTPNIYGDLPMTLGKDNYHILDYALFYSSLRENTALRAQTWLDAH